MSAPWLKVPIQRLACHVTKWNAECDRRLKRLYDDIWSNTDLVLTGSLSSEDGEHLSLHCWPDADLNGEIWHTKSTGGMFVEIQGLGERGMPLGYGTRKHESTSLHTLESELVMLAIYTRNEFLPLQALWQRLLNRPIDMVVHEDNDPCISIVKKGYSPSLRCLETFCEPAPGGFGKATLEYIKTAEHKGDLMRKYLDRASLEKALRMIRVCRRADT